MAQIFPRSANVIPAASLVLVIVLAGSLGAAWWEFQQSPYITYAGIARPQPVPFSHQHHVAGLGIDCRYCHVSAEQGAVAGVPPVSTCMNCHSQIWTNAALLEPIRESYRTGRPVKWGKANDLPDYVYFNHSIHVAKGVGCNTCHGPVDRMPLMYNQETLQMGWCLDCHRNTEKFLRPRDQVVNMRYQQPSANNKVTVDGKDYEDQESLGQALQKKYHLRSVQDITSCSTCHR